MRSVDEEQLTTLNHAAIVRRAGGEQFWQRSKPALHRPLVASLRTITYRLAPTAHAMFGVIPDALHRAGGGLQAQVSASGMLRIQPGPTGHGPVQPDHQSN